MDRADRIDRARRRRQQPHRDLARPGRRRRRRQHSRRRRIDAAQPCEKSRLPGDDRDPGKVRREIKRVLTAQKENARGERAFSVVLSQLGGCWVLVFSVLTWRLWGAVKSRV